MTESGTAPAPAIDGPRLAGRLVADARAVSAVVAGRSATQMEHRPAPNVWCAREHLAHVVRYHEVFLDRLACMLTDDRPRFERYRAEDDADFGPWMTRSVDDLLVRYAALRARLVDTVAGLSVSDLARTGVHPALGEMPIALWTEFFLAHEGHHVYAILRHARAHEVRKSAAAESVR